MSDKVCDNRSVGVIISNSGGKIALLKRAKFPIRMAPPAGHNDDHGSPEQTAIDEVEEEIGLVIEPSDLIPTAIAERRMNNKCRREGGDHHVWWVYEVDQFLGDIDPDPEETQGAAWYSKKQLQRFADRTKAYKAGKIPEAEWEQNPGLEDVWIDFMRELGYIK
ncbi:MAG TPA: NUDIX hydrolase [Candidatus Saccharimonadales bacterium]|nr:NUDIX hydrolase [Candidatus Saccharimonadales bacterium]